MSGSGGRLRLAVVLDAALEGWTSMDYFGEMLVDTLRLDHARDVDISIFQPWTPPLKWASTRPAQRAQLSIARLIARCATYPAVMSLNRWRFDAFHIVDHSYAHVARVLPGRRTGIYCHDLDALRPLAAGARAAPHQRLLARSVLRGLQRARIVFHSTNYVRQEIVERGLLDETKLVYAPPGVAAEFNPFGPTDSALDGALPQGRFILHVGSSDPRKRVELLFRAFAAVRSAEPGVFLVQQGAQLTEAQQALLDTLGLRNFVAKLPQLSRASLADLYRRASLVVLPSEREGFGLPLIEALACGTPVLASDIAAFREVGGNAATYCQSTDSLDWASAILRGMRHDVATFARDARLRQAARYSWSRHAETIVNAYRALA